jgi:hypothetical protein
MKPEHLKKLFALENDVLLIKKLREMQKILLNSGAYSTSNIEKQNMNFDRVNVPQWERNIVTKMWNTNIRLSHEALKKIDIFLDDINKELPKDNKKDTPKDMLKEKLKNHVNNL